MFTRCPSCHTIFRVRADMLRAAQGQVRCGRCAAQFNALDSLAESPDEWGEAPPPTTPEAPTTAVVNENVEAVAAPQAAAPDDAELSASTPPDTHAGAAGPAHAVTDSSNAAPLLYAADATGLSAASIRELLLHDDEGGGRHWRRRGWSIGAAVLLLVLGGLWAYLQRAYLYTYPALRPALHEVCARLACDLPLERAPDRIEVLARQVRRHPHLPAALLAEIRFVSRADRPVAYPILELRLADVSGNRVDARRFTPSDYLPAAVDPRRGLPPGAPVQVSLEVTMPRSDVVSFQIEFL